MNIDLNRFDVSVRAEILQARDPELEMDIAMRLESVLHSRAFEYKNRIQRELGELQVIIQSRGLDFDRILNASLK